jgi:hypothetical protein
MNAAYLFLAFFLLCGVAAIADWLFGVDACPHCGTVDGEHYWDCRFEQRAWRAKQFGGGEPRLREDPVQRNSQGVVGHTLSAQAGRDTGDDPPPIHRREGERREGKP